MGVEAFMRLGRTTKKNILALTTPAKGLSPVTPPGAPVTPAPHRIRGGRTTDQGGKKLY